MKKILGLDLGTNSIGWALTTQDFDKKYGEINGLGSRIIPMSQDVLGKFDSGQSHSQTAERTGYRGVRRLLQRNLLRRERLHRTLNIINFLPKHYVNAIDFEKHFGQFKNNEEVKLNYRKNVQGKHEFIFMDSFNEMVADFKEKGQQTKIPLDWTIYFLRKKALTKKISKEELAWVLLNFNQKRGYYQLRGEENTKEEKGKVIETFDEIVEKVEKVNLNEFKIILSDGTTYTEKSNYQITFVGDLKEVEIITEKRFDKKIKEERIIVSKTVSFIRTFKVFDVTNSGEIDKSGFNNFKITLDNGSVFVKKKKSEIDWLGKDKTVLFTYYIGKINRLKISAPEETNWTLIKKKTQQEIQSFNNEKKSVGVGQYIYETLLKNPSQKINGKLVKTIERSFYKEELQQILKTQINFHPELQDRKLYNDCVTELYPRNEAHQNNIKDKGFDYLFIEDIIFYQRPLKSKKSTISNCPYEERFFIKDGIKNIQPVKCIPKSHPLFQEFRLWQFIQNLKIHQKQNTENNKIDQDVTDLFFKTDDDWVLLFDFMNTKKEIEQKHIIEHLTKSKKIDKTEKDNFRWNYVEDKKYPANETKYALLSRLKKIESLNEEDFLSTEKELQLWHIIYSVKDKNEYKSALKTFAKKNNLDEDSFVENFIKFPPFKNEYGAYSEKAIKKLLPLMRMGKYWNEDKISEKVKNRISNIQERLESINYDSEVFKKDKNNLLKTIADDEVPKQFLKSFLSFKNKNHLTGLNTYQACYAVYERHSELGIIQKWSSPKDISNYLDEFKQHSLRNPIVEQVVTETLRVVRDIWIHFGESKKDFFNEIHLELGREMKNSSKKRESISKRNLEKEKTNVRIKSLLEELKNDSTDDIRAYSPSHQEILKIYEEGVYQNPNVSFSKLSEDDVEKIRKNISPTKNEIIKYKLWLEQGYISPYTGLIIPLSKLFSIDYQIEHIIPQSRYFDNSLSNKIICESEVNQLKDNKTAYEFLKEKGGSIIDGFPLLKLDDYEKHCNQYFKKNRTKLKNLLSEEIPEGFINRQLNDSRYISKFIKSLLSNIVRKVDEKEPTVKKLLPVNGAITSKLKQDWGLNDKWNEIISSRFIRLNELTNSKDYGEWDAKINAFRTKVPDEISKGFSKKRIDHRHHALDALVIACCTREHVNYLSSLNSEKENYGLRDSLLIKNKQGDYTKHFQKPWDNFTIEAKENLEKTVISFKQNLRIINKTNNKTWQWKLQNNGSYKKELVRQEGPENSNNKTNWAIRKPMHKETVSGFVKIKRIKKGFSNLTSYLDKPELILNKKIRYKVQNLLEVFNNDLKKVRKHLKDNPLIIEDKEISKIKVFEWTENATATRVSLNEKFTRKQLESITDSGIQKILENHLKYYIDENSKEQFDLAFNSDGIETLNKNIKELNNGKNHHPIYKVRLYEEGSKFSIGEIGAKSKKFVEAAQGTNLFFAVYFDKEKNKRIFETVPLIEVVAHQKQTSNISKKMKLQIQPDKSKGDFLFSLSPNDSVYIPTDEELENNSLVNFDNLTIEQISRIMVVNDFWDITCYFTPNRLATSISPKEVDLRYNAVKKKLTGSYDTKTAKFDNKSIKEICWKIKLDRLGNILNIEK